MREDGWQSISYTDYMHGVIAVVGAPLVGALDNNNGGGVSNDDTTKINDRMPRGRAGTRPALTDD